MCYFFVVGYVQVVALKSVMDDFWVAWEQYGIQSALDAMPVTNQYLIMRCNTA